MVATATAALQASLPGVAARHLLATPSSSFSLSSRTCFCFSLHFTSTSFSARGLPLFATVNAHIMLCIRQHTFLLIPP